MTQLSDYLNESNKNFLSTREIASIAARHGVKISHVSLSRYLRGEHPTPAKDNALKAFSLALNIPMEKLKELGREPLEGAPFILPAKAARLDDRERAVILQMVDVLADRKETMPSMASFALAASLEDDFDMNEGEIEA